jgi:peptidoglycan/LPS O-acetylase OafA/YrhL
MTNLIRHLRRRTTSGNWMPEIDGLRFIAILWVLLFHMHGQLARHGAPSMEPHYGLLDRFLNAGNRGVQLFFVISGYILARPFAAHHLFGKPRPSLRKYFLRRITRLEPPYILNLIAASVALIWLDHIPAGTVMPHLLASMVYMHHFLFPQSLISINSVIWSLEVEVQFYLLAPLMTMLFAIRNATLRRTTFVGLMLVSAVLQSIFSLSTWTLAGQLQYFLAGLLLADLSMTTLVHTAHDMRWDILGLIGWPLAFFVGPAGIQYWFPFLIVALYIAALRGRLVHRFIHTPWVAVTGGMCYTIYLWHPLLFTAVQRTLDRYALLMPSDYGAYFLVQAVLKCIAIAVVCLPLYLLVERPCMDPQWPQKLLRRLQQAAPTLLTLRRQQRAD